MTSPTSPISPAAAELRRLRRHGFGPMPLHGEDGEVEVVAFMREWSGYREVVLVYSELEARAYRTRSAVAIENPLNVDPTTADVLIPMDDVVTVVHALLSLPAPQPGQPPGAADQSPPVSTPTEERE